MTEKYRIPVSDPECPASLEEGQFWEDELAIRHQIMRIEGGKCFSKRVVRPDGTLSNVEDRMVQGAFKRLMKYYIREGAPSLFDIEEAEDAENAPHRKYSDLFEEFDDEDN